MYLLHIKAPAIRGKGDKVVHGIHLTCICPMDSNSHSHTMPPATNRHSQAVMMISSRVICPDRPILEVRADHFERFPLHSCLQ